jgi:catechol 2,3-dioxygenase-like lactoylglutathione lyase family enzyme
MQASLSFYRDVLGFEIVQRSSSDDDCDWVWLKRDGAELMLNRMYEPDSRPGARDKLRSIGHADTGLYMATPDVDAMYSYLVQRGITADRPVVRPYGMKQLYLKDPDGYGVCFQWAVAEPNSEPQTSITQVLKS